VSKDVTSATVKCKVKYASVSFDAKLQMLSDARIIRILHQKIMTISSVSSRYRRLMADILRHGVRLWTF